MALDLWVLSCWGAEIEEGSFVFLYQLSTCFCFATLGNTKPRCSAICQTLDLLKAEAKCSINGLAMRLVAFIMLVVLLFFIFRMFCLRRSLSETLPNGGARCGPLFISELRNIIFNFVDHIQVLFFYILGLNRQVDRFDIIVRLKTMKIRLADLVTWSVGLVNQRRQWISSTTGALEMKRILDAIL